MKVHTLSFRRVYTSRCFIIPVVIFTLLYNVPKFLELRVTWRCDLYQPPKGVNVTAMDMANMTADDMEKANVTCGKQEPGISPTAMRTEKVDVRVDILWLNLFVQILVPFCVLLVLNLR